MGNWGYNPYIWSYNPILITGFWAHLVPRTCECPLFFGLQDFFPQPGPGTVAWNQKLHRGQNPARKLLGFGKPSRSLTVSPESEKLPFHPIGKDHLSIFRGELLNFGGVFFSKHQLEAGEFCFFNIMAI